MTDEEADRGLSDTALESLSAREREVLDAACSGATAREMASDLSLAESSVRSHLAHIYAKLGVRGRVDLLARLGTSPRTVGPAPSDAVPAASPDRPWRWLAVLLAGALVLIVLAVALWPRVVRYERSGLSFEYPAAWTLHDRLPAETGFGQTLALIGTIPWGPCDDSDINCHYREHLGSGQVEVQLGVVSLFTMNICEWAKQRPDLAGRTDGPALAGIEYRRVQGRPAVRTDWVVNGSDYYGSDGWQEWMIASPDSLDVAYTISAKWHGPGDEAFLADLDHLVATLTLPSTGAAGPPGDCGSPFPR
jgi:DNA-binding CsgD family transcriptional regulator